MNHKWENDCCKKCGLVRIKKTFKLLMAIVGSVNHYKYERLWTYTDINGYLGTKRPECKP